MEVISTLCPASTTNEKFALLTVSELNAPPEVSVYDELSDGRTMVISSVNETADTRIGTINSTNTNETIENVYFIMLSIYNY